LLKLSPSYTTLPARKSKPYAASHWLQWLPVIFPIYSLNIPRLARGAACVMVKALTCQWARDVLVAAGCPGPHTDSTHADVIQRARVEIIA
jgi:hypothetical protein